MQRQQPEEASPLALKVPAAALGLFPHGLPVYPPAKSSKPTHSSQEPQYLWRNPTTMLNKSLQGFPTGITERYPGFFNPCFKTKDPARLTMVCLEAWDYTHHSMSPVILKKKKVACGTEEIAQGLGALAALPQDLSWGSSTNGGRLRATCNSSSKGSGTLFWPPQAPVNCKLYSHKFSHTHKQK